MKKKGLKTGKGRFNQLISGDGRKNIEYMMFGPKKKRKKLF